MSLFQSELCSPYIVNYLFFHDFYESDTALYIPKISDHTSTIKMFWLSKFSCYNK
jgi:hypothetical protein